MGNEEETAHALDGGSTGEEEARAVAVGSGRRLQSFVLVLPPGGRYRCK